MTWVHGPATLASADDALHSGITNALLRGNLNQAQAQSRSSIQGALQSAVTHTVADGWEWFTDFDPILFPSRSAVGGTSRRQLHILLDAKLNASGPKAAIRVHIMGDYSGTPSVDTTLGLTGYPYAEFSFELSSYVTLSDDVGPTLASEINVVTNGSIDSRTSPTNQYGYYIGISAKTDTAAPSTILSIRGIHIREVAT